LTSQQAYNVFGGTLNPTLLYYMNKKLLYMSSPVNTKMGNRPSTV